MIPLSIINRAVANITTTHDAFIKALNGIHVYSVLSGYSSQDLIRDTSIIIDFYTAELRSQLEEAVANVYEAALDQFSDVPPDVATELQIIVQNAAEPIIDRLTAEMYVLASKNAQTLTQLRFQRAAIGGGLNIRMDKYVAFTELAKYVKPQQIGQYKFKESKNAYLLSRGFLIDLYNRSTMFVGESKGILEYKVENIDTSHRYSGLQFKGGEYETLRKEVFHPNSNSLVVTI